RREGVEKFQKRLQQAPLLSDFVFAHLTGQHDSSTPEGKSIVMGELRELTELLPKQGSCRYLLTQSFREKLGLGKRFTPQSSHDASLS
ncbi:DNA primase, partial [Acinetobacter baumannii]|nr:DNA primase [Acinetobacter baumannii]